MNTNTGYTLPVFIKEPIKHFLVSFEQPLMKLFTWLANHYNVKNSTNGNVLSSFEVCSSEAENISFDIQGGLRRFHTSNEFYWLWGAVFSM